LKVNIFKPRRFLDVKEPIELDSLLPKQGASWRYATNGKSCIRHILSSLSVKHVLLPVYSCSSILWAVKKENVEYSFYDHELTSLNPSVSDIKRKILLDPSIDAVLVVSLYGNPAKFDELNQVISSDTERNICLIDDAAQAMGALYSNRPVGTYGDAGFFSFSPGKPTSGASGAYFWTCNQDYSIERTRHFWYRKIKWFFFKTIRYDIDVKSPGRAFLFLYRIFEGMVTRFLNVKYDCAEEFEIYTHRQILTANLDANDRKQKFSELKRIIIKSKFLSVIDTTEHANLFKFVIIASNQTVAISLKKSLAKSSIYYSAGYKLQDEHGSLYPNMTSLQGRIIEVPIDDVDEKHQYIRSFFLDWVSSYDE